MVEALAAYRADEPFCERILPGRAVSGFDFLDAQARLTLTLGRLDNLNGATFVQTGMMPW